MKTDQIVSETMLKFQPCRMAMFYVSLVEENGIIDCCNKSHAVNQQNSTRAHGLARRWQAEIAGVICVARLRAGL